MLNGNVMFQLKMGGIMHNKKIIISYLHSGIGNQLFEYNYINYLKNKFKVEKVYYDLRTFITPLYLKKRKAILLNNKYGIKFHLNRFFEIKPILNSYLAGILSKISKYNTKYFNNEYFPYNIDDINYRNIKLLNNFKILYLKGVFLDKELIMNETVDELRKKGYNLIKNKINLIDFKNTVSIHIRGKQYIELKTNSDYLQPINDKYYKKAIEIVNQKIKEPKYLIFSNDKQYANSLCLKIGLKNFTIVKNDEFDDLESLLLMSRCEHNIIVNSTYSYWAAILNENNNKIVISPKYFLNEKHFHYSIAQKLPQKDWLLINNKV